MCFEAIDNDDMLVVDENIVPDSLKNKYKINRK